MKLENALFSFLREKSKKFLERKMGWGGIKNFIGELLYFEGF